MLCPWTRRVSRWKLGGHDYVKGRGKSTKSRWVKQGLQGASLILASNHGTWILEIAVRFKTKHSMLRNIEADSKTNDPLLLFEHTILYDYLCIICELIGVQIKHELGRCCLSGGAFGFNYESNIRSAQVHTNPDMVNLSSSASLSLHWSVWSGATWRDNQGPRSLIFHSCQSLSLSPSLHLLLLLPLSFANCLSLTSTILQF